MMTSTLVSSIEILTCNAGTQVDFNLTHDVSTQTPNDKEQPENRNYGSADEKEKQEMKSKIAALEKFREEKDRHIPKLNAIIQETK
jgi:hypothetical protein